jgi:hypothetical protein
MALACTGGGVRLWVRIPPPGFRGHVTDLALPVWPSRRLVAALWAVERLSTSHSGPLKLPSTGTADQNLDFRLLRSNGSGTGRPRLWVQLPSEVVRPLLQVLHGLRPSTVGPIDGDAALCPPQRLLEVLGLLLAEAICL